MSIIIIIIIIDLYYYYYYYIDLQQHLRPRPMTTLAPAPYNTR